MKKVKEKNRETSNKNTTENKPRTEVPKQRKSLYYLLFKGGLWQ